MNLEDLRKRWAELNAKYPVGKSRREADPYVKDALTPQLLSVLTPREAKVMRMRYGLEDGSRHTLAEVGESTPAIGLAIDQPPRAYADCRLPNRSASSSLLPHVA